MLFANLPLAYHEERPETLDALAARAINPEVSIDAASLGLKDAARHERLAKAIRRAGLVPGIHLPFDGLSPAAHDPLILEASRQRLKSAFEAAKIYEPAHLVGHAAVKSVPLGDSRRDQLRRGLETWLPLLDSWPGHPPLYLENTFEKSPKQLARLAEGLPEGCGICFDVGHWFSFSQGWRTLDLDRWIGALGSRLGHLHLHDNSGAGDEHLGLGAGKLPLGELFTLLDQRSLTPTATMEPHTIEAFAQSLAFLAENFGRYRSLDAIVGASGGLNPF